MDVKLDCEVDVEGAANMIDREGEGASISGRLCSSLALRANNTALSPASRQPRRYRAVNALACGHCHVA
jgi:hypothetical protein